MGAPGFKKQLRRIVPETLWNGGRALYWSAPFNWVRRRNASGAARRHREDIDGLKTLLLFIGYPRSGHSLVGSLLSAHPEIVVAHELHALWYRDHAFSLTQLIALMLQRDRWFQRHNRQWTEYNYTVPGQHQGRYDRLTVIGDKKGDGVTDLVHRYPGLIEDLFRETARVGIEIKIVHTVRNPFDNIATMQRRTGDPLEYVIERHTKRVALNEALIDELGPGVIKTIHHETLIANPIETLRALTGHLGVTAPTGFLEACAGILYASPHQSRNRIPWSSEARDAVERLIARTSFLAEYRFDGE